MDVFAVKTMTMGIAMLLSGGDSIGSYKNREVHSGTS